MSPRDHSRLLGGPGSERERKAAPWPHLHELSAGAHVLPEAQKEVLLGRQDLRQLWGSESNRNVTQGPARQQSRLSCRLLDHPPEAVKDHR